MSAELVERKETSEAELKEASAAPAEIAAKRDELSSAIDDAEKRRTEAADTLSKGEAALRETTLAERDAERDASEAREARARSEARAEAAKETVAAAAERIAEDQQVTPNQLLTSLEVNPDHPIVQKMDAESDEDRFADMAWLLYEQATLAERRQSDDPATVVSRMNKLIVQMSN